MLWKLLFLHSSDRRAPRQLAFHRVFPPASAPAGHPVVPPGLGNSLASCGVPAADPLLLMKPDSSLISAYSALQGWICLAPSRAGGPVSPEGHPSMCLRGVFSTDVHGCLPSKGQHLVMYLPTKSSRIPAADKAAGSSSPLQVVAGFLSRGRDVKTARCRVPSSAFQNQ